jgi:hypothetical protein
MRATILPKIFGLIVNEQIAKGEILRTFVIKAKMNPKALKGFNITEPTSMQ